MAWICEQHEQIRAEGNKVIVSDGEYFNQCVKLNAMFKPENGGFEEGKHFFEFHCDLKKGAFVGVTTEQCFGPCYGIKALLYGGNLSDGSCLLVSSFGEPLKGKDKVGILLDLTEQELKMYVFHNDHPLGLAFHIAKPYPKPLFPVASISGPGTVAITFSSDVPTVLERNTITYSGIEGDWRIERCEKAGSLIPKFTSGWKKYTLNVIQAGSRKFFGANDEAISSKDCYRLSFCIGNRIWTTLTKMEDEKWYLSPACSTLMGVFGEASDAEYFLREFLSKFIDFSVKNDTLIFNASDDLKIIFKRFVPSAPGPYTGNPCENS
ncbi:hypothetical protein B4U79_16763 [Dinothrombium tinctorium]|uniref:SPRY domain-containing protein n=1 Tax=Dinothrombium tinctorium TaxID=1965070 RepID=A0A443QBB8_9ACAR|nr:hypothetical protein B4U79_16891 [Dinothrombium tinctorium]RWS01193.1 hypothetical protein B4U79_16763 [Dinothrombium tinctorium]